MIDTSEIKVDVRNAVRKHLSRSDPAVQRLRNANGCEVNVIAPSKKMQNVKSRKFSASGKPPKIYTSSELYAACGCYSAVILKLNSF